MKIIGFFFIYTFMKHLQIFERFTVNEAVIVPDPLENRGFPPMLNYDDLLRYAQVNNFDVVNFRDFYSSLNERDKRTAPPENSPVPFFALYHESNARPMFVVKDPRFFRVPLFVIDDIISHEFVHHGQVMRKSTPYVLPDPINRKEYFTNYEEVMAFSYTIAIDLFRTSTSFQEAVKNFSTGRLPQRTNCIGLWNDIKRLVDTKTLNKYKKYIYSYLENLYGVNQD